MKIAILAHEKFPGRAKTALGIMRYADHEVVGLLDRDRPSEYANDLVPDVPAVPIYPDADDLLTAVGEDGVDALAIGVSPIGGDFDESWRPDVRRFIEAGCDVMAGLHYFLNEDEEFAALAEEYDVELWDVREPPDDLTVSEGIADEVDAEVILTVGTDCSVGKMTATMELVDAMDARGLDVAAVPTGQTGIMIEGWGIAVDRVVSDFTAGAVERMILEAGDDHDYLVVEGQGSIVHPAYSGVTCSILHGAMPDQLVLCHDAGKEAIHGYEDTAIPQISTYVDLYEDLARPVHEASVEAGILNTSAIDDEEAAREALAGYADAVGAPADDPIRFGVESVVDRLE
jgi:uncharacterized NAD-dependent epimerase/dehydratase family protein